MAAVRAMASSARPHHHHGPQLDVIVEKSHTSSNNAADSIEDTATALYRSSDGNRS